jgi:hypothetical protein
MGLGFPMLFGGLAILLVVTNSLDGTADALCALAKERCLGLYRFNTDLINDYKFRVAPGMFVITDCTGRTVSRNELTACLWRKPWLGGEDHLAAFPTEEHRWVDAQFKSVLRDIVNICRNQRLLRLVENDAGRRADKLTQMEIASKYFDVPDWEYVFRWPPSPGERVTKPLSAELIGENNLARFVYTTIVRVEKLATEYPWLIQDKATGTRDTTAVYIAGKIFHFGVVRRRNEGAVDWRENINTDHEDRWERIPLPTADEEKIRQIMNEMGLLYGRLDFILDERTGKLSFLEVNSNGQFGWLDDETLWLHRLFLDAVMDPATTIRTPPCMHASSYA